MIAFPSMLVSAARSAGITVPPNPDGDFRREDFPHFFVFVLLQIGRKTSRPDEHHHNAHVIAGVPREKVLHTTLREFINLGLSFPLDHKK